MVLVGLTGGIGSGKSEVARLLAARGAYLIDSDVLAREAVAAGTPGLAAVVAEFGDGVLHSDGTLDRVRLAELVFADDTARGRLNAIVHPIVGALTAERLAAAPGDAVVVQDVPLLTEVGLADAFDAVIVVECPVEERVRRLVARGMSPADARARIATQASDEQRRAVATYVLDNGGTPADLARQVEELWSTLVAR